MEELLLVAILAVAAVLCLPLILAALLIALAMLLGGALAWLAIHVLTELVLLPYRVWEAERPAPIEPAAPWPRGDATAPHPPV